ncbi:uncharacterized protein K441DRAFT_658514 [Cenococcum geophilum 1.58]|uniref:uncharacterized protein n=1 Tax=Cenococcum geophilum 1.58 TaxID=794803 RepID=UPI00358ECB9E|nr:hypothetical protein K441DRAFT_658514 [Cenococcum geophilum 1.58]
MRIPTRRPNCKARTPSLQVHIAGTIIALLIFLIATSGMSSATSILRHMASQLRSPQISRLT